MWPGKWKGGKTRGEGMAEIRDLEGLMLVCLVLALASFGQPFILDMASAATSKGYLEETLKHGRVLIFNLFCIYTSKKMLPRVSFSQL